MSTPPGANIKQGKNGGIKKEVNHTNQIETQKPQIEMQKSKG
jgi:hypothetical protein